MRIIYKKIRTADGNSLYVATELQNTCGGLSLKFDNSGTCLFCGKSYRLKNGECKIDVSRLEQGCYAPTLIREGAVIECTRFCYRDGAVTLPQPSFEEFSALAVSLTKAEERLTAAECEIARLCELIRGKPLFEFT